MQWEPPGDFWVSDSFQNTLNGGPLACAPLGPLPGSGPLQSIMTLSRKGPGGQAGRAADEPDTRGQSQGRMFPAEPRSESPISRERKVCGCMCVCVRMRACACVT